MFQLLVNLQRDVLRVFLKKKSVTNESTSQKTYHEGAGFGVVFYMQCALHSGGLAHSLNRIVVGGVRHVLASCLALYFFWGSAE